MEECIKDESANASVLSSPRLHTNQTENHVCSRDNNEHPSDLSDIDSPVKIRNNSKLPGINSGSDSDANLHLKVTHDENNSPSSSDEDVMFVNKSRKLRIQHMSSSDDEKESEPNEICVNKSTGMSSCFESRIGNKRRNLIHKFKKLITSRNKENLLEDDSNISANHDCNPSDSSQHSDDEVYSTIKIKEKINERSEKWDSTIYGKDTSDEEDNHHKISLNSKTNRKSIKTTSPKPSRMSAKQAMENMQVIKSESNRMLREKEVSLPYHRPKALSLKDIMSRRKPALSSDGKALPLKMNDEQLKLYALSLEQRQKEMMELCKSDTEDEETPESVNGPNETALNSDIVSENCNEKENDMSYDIIVSKEKENTNTLFENDDNAKESATQYEEPVYNEDVSDLNSEEVKDKAWADPYKNRIDETGVNCISKTNVKDITDSHTIGNESTIGEVCNLVSKETSPIYHAIEINSEAESQLISLQYDSERIDNSKVTEMSNLNDDTNEVLNTVIESKNSDDNKETTQQNTSFDKMDFSDDDIDMQYIDKLIENAEIIQDNQTSNSPMLIKDQPLNLKPKLTGAPGMVIDLDGSDAAQPKKLSGVELLKQRFTYFAKLKTPEELEKLRQNKVKPGTQYLKLKQELGDQIAEQRSLEWAKRLDEEKQLHKELDAIQGEDSDADDELDNIESNLEKSDQYVQKNEEFTESEDDDLEEDDIILKDKPTKKNPLIADEAEESECDDEIDTNMNMVSKEVDSDNNVSDNESSDEESSDEDELNETRTKKGRIIKAFEDSDDEEVAVKKIVENSAVVSETNVYEPVINTTDKNTTSSTELATQDDELQSAQLQQSFSEDLLNSQEPEVDQDAIVVDQTTYKSLENDIAYNPLVKNDDKELNCGETATKDDSMKLAVICETQPYDANFDDIAGMCSGSFSQNIVNVSQTNETTATQELGSEVLSLCTGKFYDSKFVSQTGPIFQPGDSQSEQTDFQSKKTNDNSSKEGNLLNSILEELNDPEFDEPKPNKFFCGNKGSQHMKKQDKSIPLKKRLIIDSDDETEKPLLNDERKKRKKKRLQERALQISDDEESETEEENEDEFASDIESNAERIVEYDSEENEVEIQPQNMSTKKKRKIADFFEQEAELTSEDEWAGSGDEDEAGLDKMEREEGDDDKFHQGKLQRELEQIHMRDVLDQDKREVRLLQELLLEDGELGGGHRQRKFRWRNADGEDDLGALPTDFGESQELEDLESEEQWRKERHEREVFLRQMMEKDGGENKSLNVSVTRSEIIKANLSAKTMSSLVLEVTSPKQDKTENVLLEKKPSKDIPSPAKKAFPMLQQNYHGSILSRGSGALARLAALATPLAGDGDDAPKMAPLAPGKRNFVFATVSPASDDKPKVAKRKINSNPGTPHLIKKLKKEEKRDQPRSSLLDYLKV